MCRELTKLHEEVRRGDLATPCAASAASGEPRGEFVLVVATARPRSDPAPRSMRMCCCAQALARVSVKDAVGEVADATGLPRREIYQRALALAKEAAGKTNDGAAALEPLQPPEARPRPERVAAFQLGLSAESRAAMFLIAKGYRILGAALRRRRSAKSTSSRGAASALVFVEVKARERVDDAAEAVTERAKRRIVAAAELWLARHPDDARRNISFDVILVAPGKMPRHIANAFDASR